MRTRTVLTLAAIAGGFYLLNELRKKTESAAATMSRSPVNGLADDILGPSPQDGQWITKGQLQGILPRQYHDFEPGMGGFGKSFKSAVSRATSAVKTTVQQVKAPVVQVAKIAAAPVVAAQAAVAKAAVKLAVRKLIPGKKVEAAPAAEGEVIQYQDADGRPITKEEFDRLNAQYAAQSSAGQTPPLIGPQGVPPPPSAQPYSASDWQSADSGGSDLPRTSSVSAPSAGSPGLPLNVTSVETPSAIMTSQDEAPVQKPSSPLIPAVVGGGILAAILAFGK